MTETFGAAERYICGLFEVGNKFRFEGIYYEVRFVGKPTCRNGEPKTDIYVNAISSRGCKEFKISFKKQNADFLENKTNSERAAQLFGPDWTDVICNATLALQDEFESRPLIYKESYRRTEAGAITLGWKFELVNVMSGQLSGNMLLSRDQVIDIYAGTNLTSDKRNALVNGRSICDSGIANYVLFEDCVPRTIQEAVDVLISIDDYVDENPSVYFACKALNYRTFHSKYDGNRPLAVFVDWSVVNGKLASELVYNMPLMRGGDFAYTRLNSALKRLGVTTTDELSSRNVADIKTIWNG
jgi:hypothetical protein